YRFDTTKGSIFKECVPMDFDLDRPWLPVPSHAFNQHQRMRLPFVIEGKWKWSGKAARRAEVGKRRTGRWCSRNIVQVSAEVDVRFGVGSFNPNFETTVFLADLRLGEAVVVMSQAISQYHHQVAVCITSQNSQPPQEPSSVGPVTGEDSIATQEEVLP